MNRLVRTFRPACLGLALLVMSWAGAATGQTLYRCGSTYQDRPCDQGQPGKVVGRAAADAPAPAPAAQGDPACARRAQAAQKIIWQREAGLTELEQIDRATSPVERELIAEVYLHRGGSREIRAAIEARCVAEKEREAAHRGAIRPGVATVDSANPAPAAPLAAPAPPPQAATGIAGDRRDDRRYCDVLAQERQRLRELERAGGSVDVMERLAQQRRDNEKARAAASCTR